MDFRGQYWWLTVVSPEQRDGSELHLAPNENPAVKAFQQALYEQGQPAAMFNVDDLQAEYDRLTRQGVKFAVSPTKTPGSRFAVLDDTCGNLIQLTQMEWS